MNIMNDRKHLVKDHFSLYFACRLSAVFQVLLALVLWGIINTERPRAQLIGALILIAFLLSASFGFFAISKRSFLVLWFYKLQVGGCVAVGLVIAMDVLKILSVLPVDVPVLPLVSKLRRAHLRPDDFMKQIDTPLSMFFFNDTPKLIHPIDTQFSSAMQPDFISSKRVYSPSMTHRDMITHRPSIVNGVKVPISSLTRLYASNSRKPQIKKESTNTSTRPAETEGETEEVSRDELPPEVRQLPKELQQEVTATAKVVKHVIKFMFSGVLASCFLFELYCTYVVLTFILNKCTSVDELIHHPEQFPPIVHQDSSTSISSEEN